MSNSITTPYDIRNKRIKLTILQNKNNNSKQTCLKIASFNLQGSLDKNTLDLIDLLKKENIDFCCLQEPGLPYQNLDYSHHSLADLKTWPEFTSYGFIVFTSCFRNSSNKNQNKTYSSSSTLITIVKKEWYPYVIRSKSNDPFIQTLKIQGPIDFTLFNCYIHHNRYFQNSTIKALKKLINKKSILCGDFNTISDINKDYYTTGNNTPSLNKKLLKIVDSFKLIDSFRYCNPHSKKFSHWNYSFTDQKNPRITATRIDYILVSKKLKSKILNSDIVGKPYYKSDHKPVFVCLNLNSSLPILPPINQNSFVLKPQNEWPEEFCKDIKSQCSILLDREIKRLTGVTELDDLCIDIFLNSYEETKAMFPSRLPHKHYARRRTKK